MYRANFIVLTCAIALSVGCASHKKHKNAPTTQLAQTETSDQTTWSESASSESASNDSAATESNDSATTESASAAQKFAGRWQLAMPRKNQKSATITISDNGRVVIDAGKNLSGKYAVQGSYLLILTDDEQLRPLAWRINSADSLTVVRFPDFGGSGPDYTGATLVRAASETASADENADSFADTEVSEEAFDADVDLSN